MDYQEYVSTEGTHSKYRYAFLAGWIRDEEERADIIVPITEISQSPVDAQRLLLKRVSGQQHGPFSDRFRELATLTLNLEDVSPEMAEHFLAGEEKRTGDQFEAMGLKIPAENAIRWGAILVLAVQLYLWVHLYEFRKRLGPDDPGWEVAWIGVYSSNPARLLLLFSLLAIPLLAIVALGLRGVAIADRSRLSWTILAVSSICCLVLDFAVIRCLPARAQRTSE